MNGEAVASVGARHVLNVCGDRRDRMSIQKLKDLLFLAWLSGGAGLLILLMYFLFSDF